MENDLLRMQADVYRRAFMKHGDDPRSTIQNDRLTQYLRFERLIRELFPAEGAPSIHDVGSGLCDMHAFLNQLGIQHVYSGTEIVEEMSDRARELYPGIELKNRDIINAAPDERYDYIVLSGTLNYIPEGTDREAWRAYCLQLIDQMFAMCRHAISFNFMTTVHDFGADNLLYFDPEALFSRCARTLSRHVVLDHGYPLYEATITVFRKEWMTQRFPAPPLARYLVRSP